MEYLQVLIWSPVCRDILMTRLEATPSSSSFFSPWNLATLQSQEGLTLDICFPNPPPPKKKKCREKAVMVVEAVESADDELLLKVIRKFFLTHNKSFRWHLGDYEKHDFFSI